MELNTIECWEVVRNQLADCLSAVDAFWLSDDKRPVVLGLAHLIVAATELQELAVDRAVELASPEPSA